MSSPFLSLSYDELERRNLDAKERYAQADRSDHSLREHYRRYLEGEDQIKAVTLAFSDLEGRLHMLDYDKRFLLSRDDALTFDGSSVNGFATVNRSDLRLIPDWGSFRWLPADVFGPGKVILFASIRDQDGSIFPSDLRSRLTEYCWTLSHDEGLTSNVAVECEGFLFEGLEAEQNYDAGTGFRLVSQGGYFHSLPGDPLRAFIDRLADAKRALGFENEKDHPEVAPSQFELNYRYAPAVIAADQILLYKLLARQIAASMGYTASFLPKPVAGINGNGMHCNISLSRGEDNAFYGGDGQLSALAKGFVERILFSANEMSLILNPSVNAYRRLDPAFEAPNQIKSSDHDRTSMIRIPLADAQSTRIEVRTVSPDANPYLLFYALLRIGLEGPTDPSPDPGKRPRTRFLPDHIQSAMRQFKGSDVLTEILGGETKEKYWACKGAAADRCPRALGERVKKAEIVFHHEVTNQLLWSTF